RALPWGRATQRPGKLYLHVFDSSARQIEMPGLQARIKNAYFLGGRAPLNYQKSGTGYQMQLPGLSGVADDPLNLVRVVVLEVDGAVKVEPVLLQADAQGKVALSAEDATVTGGLGYEGGDKRAIGYWTNASDTVSWEFKAPAGAYRVEVEYACEPPAAGSTFEVAVDGSALKGTVESTGGWSTFKTVSLGTVQLGGSERHKLVVRALSMPHGAVMNLRAVRLQSVVTVTQVRG
ncbi:MAG TPA: carbohydrate-binding domain-containing protein, partial [Fimbriimonas sp.]|nr:carbohydrate-binding domain-containing protein [Fimbriimonas sp.]